MGEALRSFFQSVSDLLAPKREMPPAPPMIGGYKVDYSALTDAQIASPAPCDDVFQAGNWVSVNRRP
jgi:hypothetical protein